MLYQTEPHSDFRKSNGPWTAICVEEGAYSHPFRTSQAGNSRLFRNSVLGENSYVFSVASPKSLAYLTAPRSDELRGALVLLGNGVMVTLRFLVPSF